MGTTFQINPEKLSDGSTIYNVVGLVPGGQVTIGCVSEQAARQVRDTLNDANLVAWMEVAG